MFIYKFKTNFAYFDTIKPDLAKFLLDRACLE